VGRIISSRRRSSPGRLGTGRTATRSAAASCFAMSPAERIGPAPLATEPSCSLDLATTPWPPPKFCCGASSTPAGTTTPACRCCRCRRARWHPQAGVRRLAQPARRAL